MVSFPQLWTLSALALSTLTKLGSCELLAQASPAWLTHIAMPTNHQLVKQYPTDVKPTTDLSYLSVNLDMSKYPAPLEKPPVDHPEIQKVMNDIDWSKVPTIEARKVDNFVLDRSNYDTHADPDCWWSVSTCKKPKVDYLPEDIYYCPRAGDWGLNYDDGPYKKWFPVTIEDKAHDQPRFYNYLLKNGNQKATLFCKLRLSDLRRDLTHRNKKSCRIQCHKVS